VSRSDATNGALLGLAVCASFAAAASPERAADVRVEQIAPSARALRLERSSDGSRALRDASGTLAPLRRYERIASTSLVADGVLLELCEPERLIAVTTQTKERRGHAQRHAARAGIDSPADLERILSLAPDLVLINHFGDPRYAARLREQGLVVFDLGEMHGVATLLPSIHAIGLLVGEQERASVLAARFEQRLGAIASDVPEGARPRALYLSAYGKQLFAGTTGSSYHDVLLAAGLEDAAAQTYRGWPALSAEQVLALDPELLVTKQGMAKDLCGYPGLAHLRPCRTARVYELDGELADDPGLPMLELAEALRTQVHGPRR
jgi:iron complex transport system substrate-binding protein